MPRKVPMGNLPKVQTGENSVAFLQAMLASPRSTGEIKIEYQGQTLTLQYKPLGWLAKSRCVSTATQYEPDENGSMRAIFRLDKYYISALREMLGETAPFPLSDKVMESIPPEIGEQLLAMIPDAFSGGEKQDPLKKV